LRTRGRARASEGVLVTSLVVWKPAREYTQLTKEGFPEVERKAQQPPKARGKSMKGAR